MGLAPVRPWQEAASNIEKGARSSYCAGRSIYFTEQVMNNNLAMQCSMHAGNPRGRFRCGNRTSNVLELRYC